MINRVDRTYAIPHFLMLKLYIIFPVYLSHQGQGASSFISRCSEVYSWQR